MWFFIVENAHYLLFEKVLCQNDENIFMRTKSAIHATSPLYFSSFFFSKKNSFSFISFRSKQKRIWISFWCNTLFTCIILYRSKMVCLLVWMIYVPKMCFILMSSSSILLFRYYIIIFVIFPGLWIVFSIFLVIFFFVAISFMLFIYAFSIYILGMHVCECFAVTLH